MQRVDTKHARQRHYIAMAKQVFRESMQILHTKATAPTAEHQQLVALFD